MPIEGMLQVTGTDDGVIGSTGSRSIWGGDLYRFDKPTQEMTTIAATTPALESTTSQETSADATNTASSTFAALSSSSTTAQARQATAPAPNPAPAPFDSRSLSTAPVHPLSLASADRGQGASWGAEVPFLLIAVVAVVVTLISRRSFSRASTKANR